MAHFAKLDENNKVIDVIVVSNDMMIGLDGKEKEENGINFLNSIYGFYPRWIQTSYNANFRKAFAGIGYTYDSENDGFISPSPYDRWVFDKSSWEWKPPKDKPSEEEDYIWVEEEKDWILLE